MHACNGEDDPEYAGRAILGFPTGLLGIGVCEVDSGARRQSVEKQGRPSLGGSPTARRATSHFSYFNIAGTARCVVMLNDKQEEDRQLMRAEERRCMERAGASYQAPSEPDSPGGKASR